jgi:hypothetical protein
MHSEALAPARLQNRIVSAFELAADF